MRMIDANVLKRAINKDKALRQYLDCGHAKSWLMQTIDEQPTIQSEQHWIPVTERLPEDDTVVLVCGKSGGVYTAIHNNSKTWIRGWWKMNSKNHHCNPIAWMPLPQPYKWKE